MKNTERFSDRVENYIRYRPSYPPEILRFLEYSCQLSTDSIIADIGSGTGILSELFLQHGNPVYGVEPNGPMREAAERLLQGYPRFTSVAASAEETSLAPASVDFITAGQAFHWFDQQRARAEFQRILRPQGWVVLIWNERRDANTAFARAYENLLIEYGTDYTEVRHQHIDETVIRSFFGGDFAIQSFENQQIFDFEGLRGRLLSSSYVPQEGHPKYAPMLTALQRIFHMHKQGDSVSFEYDTNVYYGRISV